MNPPSTARNCQPGPRALQMRMRRLTLRHRYGLFESHASLVSPSFRKWVAVQRRWPGNSARRILRAHRRCSRRHGPVTELSRSVEISRTGVESPFKKNVFPGGAASLVTPQQRKGRPQLPCDYGSLPAKSGWRKESARSSADPPLAIDNVHVTEQLGHSERRRGRRMGPCAQLLPIPCAISARRPD